jgi:Na+/melibiose symporter-like transporter
MNARLANPLQGYTYGELRKMGRAYAYDNALAEPEDVRAMEIGACLARDLGELDHANDLGLSEEELDVLKNELEHRWAQPRLLYLVIALCSLCAAVQGMDETVVNGAQLFYAPQFGIGGDSPRSTWLVGLTNAAPYLCCAFVGCWLTTPFNNWFGRRGTIFITCLFSAIACFWQGFVNVGLAVLKQDLY